MPATINKQRVVTQLFATLAKRMDEKESSHNKPEPLPVLEQFLYAICREGTTREKADSAFRNLRENFYDWNEIRVSSVREVADTLDDLPQSEIRAQRIIKFLQEVFETTFSFDLEALHKKGLKEAEKKLSRFEAANDYCVSWVIQQSLGGHSIPLDVPTIRVIQRLGLIELEQVDKGSIQSNLEHQIPKAKGTYFTDIISNLAEEFCSQSDPQCIRCVVNNSCPKIFTIPEGLSSKNGIQNKLR